MPNYNRLYIWAKCHVCGEVKTILTRGTTAGTPVCEDCRRDLDTNRCLHPDAPKPERDESR